MENTIENFINFCDDMKIDEYGVANESFADIKKRIVEVLENILYKLKLFLAKITKNKNVNVNKKFYDEYKFAKGRLDSAYREHCRQFSEGHIQTYWTEQGLGNSNASIREINELSADPVEGETAYTINLYDIYKALLDSQNNMKSEISYINSISDPDDFEKLNSDMLIKIHKTYISFYTAVYNKIK